MQSPWPPLQDESHGWFFCWCVSGMRSFQPWFHWASEPWRTALGSSWRWGQSAVPETESESVLIWFLRLGWTPQPKAALEGKGLFGFLYSPSPRKAKAGPRRQEPKQRPWRHCVLPCFLWSLSLLYIYYLLRDGTAHGGLGSLTSTINRGNALQTCPRAMWQTVSQLMFPFLSWL